METLYQNTVVIKRLRKYFQPYISLLTKPSGHKAFMLMLAILAMQFTTSINHIFKWFLCGICDKSLNSYYYFLKHTCVPWDKFLKITIELAVSLIPEELADLPIFLAIDDTLQEKFGTRFECYQTMFDHSKHNGTNYLKGHCFVAMTICIPVLIGKDIRYFHIPVGHRLRKDGENKLKIASTLIDMAMKALVDHPMVILLCDSWYPKGDVVKAVKRHKNLEMIANARVDTCIFELPPPHTGKRGRPATKGRQLDIHNPDDFHYIRVGDYFVTVKEVLTNLFGTETLIYLTVTAADLSKHNTYRVFISTVLPKHLNQQFRGREKTLSQKLNAQILWLLPLYLYSFRWGIEIMFYEQKTFWSLGLYRIRSKEGIESFVNLSSLAYSCMCILPHLDERFSCLVHESPQTCKYLLGDAIRYELFLWRFDSKTENHIYSLSFLDSFNSTGDTGSKVVA